MTGLLLFVLPDGRSAEVSVPSARLICDRLWDLGIAAGAATAATRLSEAIHSQPIFGTEVKFNEREVTPLIAAAQAHPPTWASLLETSNLTAVSPAKRRQLLITRDNLLASLAYDEDHHKVSALIGDIERLRDNLRASEP